MTKPLQNERTLDPDTPGGWEEVRALAHRMVDHAFDHMQTRRDQPVWQKPTPDVRQMIEGEGVPRSPQSADLVCDEFLGNVLPFAIGNTHPRFWGWVMGGGTPIGVIAEMLAATMNPNVGGFDDAATLVEKQVVRWLAEMMGFPESTTGLLMSGGTMANLIGLVVGRYARAGFDVRAEGIQGGGPVRAYCSTEVHSWLKKSMEVMGMGRASLKVVGVDGQFRMRLDELRQAIAEDRAAGVKPMCVVATAGTVNTGATDDLEAIADLCEAEGMWFHVDGAFGAPAYWSESLRPLLKGMERADSLAFDLHKWGSMPYEIGCVLIRDRELHREAFAFGASYLTGMERGAAAGELYFSNRNVELSRGFRALKAWMSLKVYGVEAMAAVIEQNVEQAQYLAGLVQDSEVLELAADVPLNIVCFRYRGATDAQNKEILMRLQESGVAVPSSTVIDGRFAIRVAHCNHRTRCEDFELLVREVERVGGEVVGGV